MSTRDSLIEKSHTLAADNCPRGKTRVSNTHALGAPQI